MQSSLIPGQNQKTALSPTTLRSLYCLQMSSCELTAYIQETALSNPLLDVELPDIHTVFPEVTGVYQYDDPEYSKGTRYRSNGDFCGTDYYDPLCQQSLSEYLSSQIRQMRIPDLKMQNTALFLVACLDSRGYLDCPLETLSEEFSLPLFLLEQGLYIVQMLDPPGVGARDISECLLLQLARSPNFNRLTVRIAQDGLHLLSTRNYAGLGKLLQTGESAVRQAANVIMSLNPIPSRGFSDGERIGYCHPDAYVIIQGGHTEVAVNSRILPHLSVNEEYVKLLKTSNDPVVSSYIREKLADAQQLIAGIEGRSYTLARVIKAVVEYQQAFFLSQEDLKPLTLQQLAEKLGITVSTVSRATQGKYIQFDGRIIPLRELFPAGIPVGNGAYVSSHATKKRIAALIKTEPPNAPLSDEEIRQSLHASGITVSRRAVAKYRTELGIPSSFARRK